MDNILDKNYGDEAHALLNQRIDHEAATRREGDKANENNTKAVSGLLDTTNASLGQEVLDRSAGDLLSQEQYEKLYKDSVTKWSGIIDNIFKLNTDLSSDINTNEVGIKKVNDEVYNLKQLLVERIATLETDTAVKMSAFDIRVKKYETMLSDITADSHQITADNGEVPLGAWTILSQARVWDLEILAQLRKYADDINDDLKEKIESIEDGMISTEDIKEMINDLSNVPIIKELDERINGIDQDIIDAQNALLKEQEERQQAILDSALDNADKISKATDELTQQILAEHDQRVDAIQREAAIRAAQLKQEAIDRSKEIEDKIKETNGMVDKRVDELIETTDKLTADLLAENAARVEAVSKLDDGLNKEIIARIDGDSNLNSKIETLKSSTETSLAAVTNEMTALASDTAANAKAITAVDGRVTAVDKELKTTTKLAASASTKAETAISTTEAQGRLINGITVSLNELREGVEQSNEATAVALNAIEANVKKNAEGVETNSSSITKLGGEVSVLSGTVKGNTTAIRAVEVRQVADGKSIEQLTKDTALLKNDVTALNKGMESKVSSEAFQELSSEVKAQGSTIQSNSQSITRLNDSVTQINKDMANKASAKSVSDLTNRVTATEKGVTSNSASIVGLNNEVSTVKKGLSTKAENSAVQALTSDVTAIDGRVTANTNATTTLKGRVDSQDKLIAKKVDATVLVDYYTKIDADKATTGAIQAYDSNLVIGSDNRIPTILSAYELGWYNTITGEPASGSDAHIRTKKDVHISIKPSTTYTIRSKARTVAVLYREDNTVAVRHDKPASRLELVFTSPADAKYVRYHLFEAGTTKGADATQQILDELKLFVYEGKNNKTDWVPSQLGVEDTLEANASVIETVKTEVSKIEGNVKANTESLKVQSSKIDSMDKQLGTTTATASQALNKANTAASDNAATASRLDSVSASLDKTNKELANKASISSYNELKSEVSKVDGKTATNASNISGLQGRMTNAEAGNKANADAVSGLTVKQNEQGKSIDNLVRSNTTLTSSLENTNKELAGVKTEVGKKASATAVSNLEARTLKNEGDIVATNNATTKLTGRVDNHDKQIANKAESSVLVKYSTHDQTNKAVSDGLIKYDSELILGGANVLVNSEKERSSGSSEYYLYERSSDLMRFYDDNLGSSISISFELSSPVAGQISVYSSNSTKHRFEASITVKEINKYIRYEVQAIPRINTGPNISTDASTLEFFGQYGSGRVFRVRRVQVERGSKSSEWRQGQRDTDAKLEANASAIQNTNSTVQKQGETITANSTNILALNTKVNDPKTGLAANASAVTSLQSRVTKTEGSISTLNEQQLQLKGEVGDTKTRLQNNYYTMNQSDKAMSGEVSKYSASMANTGGNTYSDFSIPERLTGGEPAAYYSKPAQHGFTIQNSTNNFGSFRFYGVVTEAGEWTVTFEAKTDSGSKVWVDLCDVAAVTYTQMTGEYKLYTGTVTLDAKTAAHGFMDFGVFYGTTSIRNMRISKGSVPMPWAASEKDVSATALRQTESKITAVDGKVSAQAQDILTLTSTVNDIEKNLKDNVTDVVDLTGSGYGHDTYYPVVFGTIATNIRSYFGVTQQLDGSSKPTWSTHSSGFTVSLFWSSNGSGWGSAAVERVVDSYSYLHTTGSPITKIDQMSPSSEEVVWLRGGAKYQVSRPKQSPIRVGKSNEKVWSAQAGSNVFVEQSLFIPASVPVAIHKESETNKVQLQATSKVVDGISAVNTVAVDNNGFISGYGLISQLVNGVVVSAFGVNADMFYVGTNNNNKKKPFIVLTTPQVINGTLYPVGTWIDTAVIANATIGTAHIQDLAVTNAKIANIHGNKIFANTIVADHIAAEQVRSKHILGGSVTADKLYSNTVSGMFGNFGRFETSMAGKGKTVISGTSFQVFDANGRERIFLGIR